MMSFGIPWFLLRGSAPQLEVSKEVTFLLLKASYNILVVFSSFQMDNVLCSSKRSIFEMTGAGLSWEGLAFS